nr:MAG TPA: RNA editing ligase [Caudoviricetes sp.]
MDFNKYPKIETCFQRSLETKKLLDGVWRSDELQYLKDCEWIWTEKVDGANIPQPLMEYLETTFGGEVNEEIFEQLFGETEVILFGEGYSPKIQSGGGYRKDVSFILFDVKIGNFWLLRDKVEEIAKQLGIDVVPLIGYGPIQFAIDFVKEHPMSRVAQNNGGSGCYMEGLVGTPTVGLLRRNGERIQVKIKWNDFKEFVEE